MSYSDRLHKVIPGGAHTYSRGDDQFPLNAPQILEKGQGCYVWDPDGNRYLDYGMALRAVTIGYDEERVSQAAIKQIRNGNNLTRASLIELEAAETMVDLIEGADMVKFAKNGSVVTTAAVKLARAYTGRKYVAVCSDHPFFTYDDWFIGTTPVLRGIPEEHRGLTLTFHYNDLPSLKALFEQHPDQIACVIMEPSTSAPPQDNFLHKVKALCHDRGAVFILDEMITGFRYHLGGAQKHYDIQADLSTFGKGMANGFSVAALVGRKEIMNLGGIREAGQERVFLISTTHGAEMAALGAFVETVKLYRERAVTDHLWSYGQKLIDGMNQVAREQGVGEQFFAGGFACSPGFTTLGSDGKPSLEMRTLFVQEMLKQGVMMPWIALCASHGEKELQMTLEALTHALQVYSRALNDGATGYLKGRAIKPVFRAHN